MAHPVLRRAFTRRQAPARFAGALLVPASAWAKSAARVDDKDPPPPVVSRKLALPDMVLLDGTAFCAQQPPHKMEPCDADADNPAKKNGLGAEASNPLI